MIKLTFAVRDDIVDAEVWTLSTFTVERDRNKLIKEIRDAGYKAEDLRFLANFGHFDKFSADIKQMLFYQYCGQTNKPSYFPSLDEIETDILISLENFNSPVYLHVNGATLLLSEFKTKEEIIQSEINSLSVKYLDDFYIHNREELDEFLRAIDFLERNRKFNPWEDYGEFEFDDSKLEKNLHDARLFPILVLYKHDSSDDYHKPSTTYRFLDSTLGL